MMAAESENSSVMDVVPSHRVPDEMISHPVFDGDTTQEPVLPCKVERQQSENIHEFVAHSPSNEQNFATQQSQHSYSSGQRLPDNKGNLVDLPNDLLLHIFSICDARTVAKLRQCCKAFYELSKEQIVWLEVLKRTCKDLDLPFPSFPRTTGANIDIELLATAWIRFQRVLRYAHSTQPPPHQIVRTIDIATDLLCFHQTLDGRFLFLVHSTGIRVWSLAAASPQLTNSFTLEIPGDCPSLLCCGTESDTSFILYLSLCKPSHNLDEWLAFRFSFSRYGHGDTKLDFLSKLNCLPFSATQWGMISWQSTLLITYFQQPLEGKCWLLWDPEEGTCATWVADANDSSNDPTFFFVDGFVASFDKASQAMVVYALPEIPPKESYAPRTYAQLSNPALLHIPARTDRLNHQLVASVCWVPSSKNGYAAFGYDCRAMVYDTGDGSWLLEQVAFHLTDSPSNTFAPFPLALERSSSLQISDPDSFSNFEDEAALAYIFPDQNLLLHALSSDITQIVFHLNTLTEDSGRVEVGRGVLYSNEKAYESIGYCLSPFAGRLCVVTPGKVQVIDFVELPDMRNIPTVLRMTFVHDM
ncbi:hypothetical protein DL96DRAFT_269755 [Flagelloscypha sp. PMI_526]|nr:hypothetical protein DL96DRAFT_269755 [Flagelloscypha sp. PMI_526]